MKTICIHDNDNNRTLLKEIQVDTAVSCTSQVNDNIVQFIVGWSGSKEDFKQAIVEYLERLK